MFSSQESSKVMAAFVKAQAEMPAIKFDSINPYYNSSYASLGAIIKTVTPILKKHGLAVTQHMISGDDNKVGVETVLLHESGEFIYERALIPMPETKNVAQEFGKITSYMRRYALAGILGIYADQDDDGNSVSDGTDKKQSEPKKKENKGTTDKSNPTRPYKPEELAEALIKMTKFVTPATNRQVEFLAMLLSQETVDDDERHRLQNYLFGNESLTKADKKLVNAAIKWLDPTNDAGTYIISDMATEELALVLEFLNS